MAMLRMLTSHVQHAIGIRRLIVVVQLFDENVRRNPSGQTFFASADDSCLLLGRTKKKAERVEIRPGIRQKCVDVGGIDHINHSKTRRCTCEDDRKNHSSHFFSFPLLTEINQRALTSIDGNLIDTLAHRTSEIRSNVVERRIRHRGDRPAGHVARRHLRNS